MNKKNPSYFSSIWSQFHTQPKKSRKEQNQQSKLTKKKKHTILSYQRIIHCTQRHKPRPPSIHPQQNGSSTQNRGQVRRTHVGKPARFPNNVHIPKTPNRRHRIYSPNKLHSLLVRCLGTQMQ